MNGFNRIDNQEKNVNTNATKSELEEFRGTFSGKLFKGEGTNKNGAWQRFKLVFLTADGKEINFGAFNPMSDKSIQVDKLNEGTSYVVVYKKSYFEMNGEQAYSKNAIIIKPSTLQSSNANGNAGQHEPLLPTVSTSSPASPPTKFNMAVKGVPTYDNDEHEFSETFLDMFKGVKDDGLYSTFLELYKKNFTDDPIKAAACWKKYVLKE